MNKDFSVQTYCGRMFRPLSINLNVLINSNRPTTIYSDKDDNGMKTILTRETNAESRIDPGFISSLRDGDDSRRNAFEMVRMFTHKKVYTSSIVECRAPTLLK
jgi:hypothetical protein